VTYLLGQEGEKDIFAKLEHRALARTLSGKVEGVGDYKHSLVIKLPQKQQEQPIPSCWSHAQWLESVLKAAIRGRANSDTFTSTAFPDPQFACEKPH